MGLRLMVWDAPNIDRTIGDILRRRPSATERPDLREVMRWLRARAGDDTVEATVFVNIPVPAPLGQRGWIQFLTEVGYDVFAKPKSGYSDIDEDMVAHIRRRLGEGGLAEVLIASHDARRFVPMVPELREAGVTVSVLGFPEFAGSLASTSGVDFIDMEDVPGVFRTRLDRVRLLDLPTNGRWFTRVPVPA